MRWRQRTPLRDYPAQRIALIKPSALGDIVHSLPVLTAVRHRYPAAHITWVVNRGYEPLLRGHPDLNATLPFDRKASGSSLPRTMANYGRFLHRLRQEHFDLAIDLQGLLRSGLMAAASGARRRVGLSTAREGATRFYTDVVPVADFNAIHAVDRYWLLAEALGAGDTPKCFRFPLLEAEQCWAKKVLHEQPRPWLFVAAGSRWMTKRWPPQSFAALVQWAQERFGGTAVFVGAANEVTISQAAAARLNGPTIDLTGQTTLPQLVTSIAQADVMLANDTGPLHLAAALGRPVVAPYTCTKVLLNGPYRTDHGTVESRVWCQGSYLKQCDRLECMAELTPERLWPALERVLQAWQTNHRSA